MQRLTMKLRRISLITIAGFLISVPHGFDAQTQAPQSNSGVVRLNVRYKSEQGMKGLPRKRFFLIRGSVDQNAALIQQIKRTNIASRQCYYRSRGASDALIKWLKDNDCESVYCREVEEKYLSGADAVPEFQAAFEEALRELKDRQVARRWLTNYMAPEIRSGHYSTKQLISYNLAKLAEQTTGRPPMSIMTDRKGTAYLTNIEPGVYTISNLIGSETEKTSILWICEREVKATDLGIAMKRPFMLSNEKDPKVKCEIVERPLPVCP
jgi:hypothetical protein